MYISLKFGYIRVLLCLPDLIPQPKSSHTDQGQISDRLFMTCLNVATFLLWLLYKYKLDFACVKQHVCHFTLKICKLLSYKSNK